MGNDLSSCCGGPTDPQEEETYTPRRPAVCAPPSAELTRSSTLAAVPSQLNNPGEEQKKSANAHAHLDDDALVVGDEHPRFDVAADEETRAAAAAAAAKRAQAREAEVATLREALATALQEANAELSAVDGLELGTEVAELAEIVDKVAADDIERFQSKVNKAIARTRSGVEAQKERVRAAQEAAKAEQEALRLAAEEAAEARRLAEAERVLNEQVRKAAEEQAEQQAAAAAAAAAAQVEHQRVLAEAAAQHEAELAAAEDAERQRLEAERQERLEVAAAEAERIAAEAAAAKKAEEDALAAKLAAELAAMEAEDARLAAETAEAMAQAEHERAQREEAQRAEAVLQAAAVNEAMHGGVDDVRKLLMRRVDLNTFDGSDDKIVYTEQWEEKWDVFSESRDPQGEVLMLKMVKLLTDAGTCWKDPDFPADSSSLFKDELSNDEIAAVAHGEQTFRKDKDPFLAGVEGIEWKRAADMLDPDEPVVVWSADIHSDDIQQGRLGDCYYLAALASCAVGEKDILIRDLIVEDGMPVGVFGVKFYLHGRWITVPVDDYFPCTLSEGQWRPIFASPSTGTQQAGNEKEIWPMVFEKAWAKLHGSYEATAGGQTCDALNYLCGGIVRHIHCHVDNEDEWQQLLSLQEEHNKHEIVHDKEHNPFLSCSVSSAVDEAQCKLGGLINGHAYSVLCIVETVDGHRLLNLRNPWGSFEWTGDFSDDSDKWTPELKLEVGADDSEGDDGSFWMSYVDFCKYFDEVGVCDPMFIPKALLEEGEGLTDTVCHVYVQTVGSEWKAGVNAGGRPGFCLTTRSDSTTFKYNPTFSIKADQNRIILQMYQPDTRGDPSPQRPWMDMYLYLIDPNDPTSPSPKRILYLQRRQQYVAIDVEPGKEYRLVAAAWGAGVTGRFWISAAAKGLEFNCLQSPPPDAAAAEQMGPAALHAGSRCALCVKCGHGPIKGRYYELEEGQCHSECYEDYIIERKKATAAKCFHCDQRIMEDSWSVFEEEDGTKINVHKECAEGYKISKAPKCEQCKEALVGGYVVLSGANLHEDCVDAYREAQAPKCPQCGKAVMGSYYPYSSDQTSSGKDEQVHVECSDAYDAAVKAAKARP